jgi:hypothetical protein
MPVTPSLHFRAEAGPEFFTRFRKVGTQQPQALVDVFADAIPTISVREASQREVRDANYRTMHSAYKYVFTSERESRLERAIERRFVLGPLPAGLQTTPTDSESSTSERL